MRSYGTNDARSSDLYWSSCPVGNTLIVAEGRETLNHLFAKENISIEYLGHGSASGEVGSFSGDYPRLFRFGGDAPPMVARAHGADTVVVGIIPYRERRGIAVRHNSTIKSVAELRGKKAVVARGAKRESHFLISVPYRDYIIALEANGLTEEEVQYIKLARGSYPEGETKGSQVRFVYTFLNRFIKAVVSGEADATWAGGVQATQLELEGKIRIIYDLEEHPEFKAGALIITVPGDLAREFPELVIKFLQMIVRTGRWSSQNRDQVIKIFARDAGVSEKAVILAHPADFHNYLIPGFSEKNVAALKQTESFLKDHEFIGRDFRMEDWLEEKFLHEALKLEGE